RPSSVPRLPPPPSSPPFPYTTLFRSFRLSSLALDDRTAGLERVRREVLAGLINPMRGLSRVGYAQAWRRGSLPGDAPPAFFATRDRKSTRLNSSHVKISYAVFCLKKQ